MIQSSAFVFERLKNIAEELLRSTDKNHIYTQAIVLLTETGNEYGAVIENPLTADKKEEKYLISQMADAMDTAVSYILCLWKDGDVDLPSYDFREMIESLDPKNADTSVFVLKDSGYSAVRLENTMK